MNVGEYLKSAIALWKQTELKDEWYFSNLRDELSNKLSSENAFIGINEIIPILSEEKDSYIFIELIEIIIFLAQKSETTELPLELSHNWGDIAARLKSQDEYAISKLDELVTYYHLKD